MDENNQVKLHTVKQTQLAW